MAERSHGIRRFVLLSLVALAPVLLLVALYVVKDPFHVLKPYTGESQSAGDTLALTVNTGYLSTEAFKYYYPQKQFDSFIFGSSLSGYYRIEDWLKHLPEGASAFHFNASRETLHGILNKLNFLADRGVKVTNALIVMEDEMLKRKPLDGDVLYVQHPQTAPTVSWWAFHQLYFNAFRHPELVAFTACPTRETARMVLEGGYATTDIPDRIEPINEGYYRRVDSLIAVNPGAFFTPDHLQRYSHPMKTMPCPDKLNPKAESLLRDIARVLDQMGTRYQIIIPPHYASEAISSADLCCLESIFGNERVHDYSHDKAMGTDLHYYYDDGHLIAAACARLMDSAYAVVTFPSPYLENAPQPAR